MHHAGQCPVEWLRLLFIDAGGIRDAMMGSSRSHGNRNGVVAMAMATAMANSSKLWRRTSFKRDVSLTLRPISCIPSHLRVHLRVCARSVTIRTLLLDKTRQVAHTLTLAYLGPCLLVAIHPSTQLTHPPAHTIDDYL